MRLLCASPSPFASKVRMAACKLGIELAEEFADTNSPTPEFLAWNPLGKLPVLIRDDGTSVFDSVAIMHFFDRHTKGKLYPTGEEERIVAEKLEALVDGITDCLLAVIYERRFRPEEKIQQEWIDRQWEKATRGLDQLAGAPPSVSQGLHGGHFALAAKIGYLELRFPGQWEKGRSSLLAWIREFEAVFPSFQRLKPLPM